MCVHVLSVKELITLSRYNIPSGPSKETSGGTHDNFLSSFLTLAASEIIIKLCECFLSINTVYSIILLTICSHLKSFKNT